MPEHTPGPWETGDIIFGARTVVTTEGDHIAEVMVRGRDRGESARNADLIAAAPELADALTFLCAEIHNRCALETLEGYVAEIEPILDRARGEGER